jgi:hypothetical protein
MNPTERMATSGDFNGMGRHRVRMEKVADVDSESIHSLKQAHEAG